MKGKNKMKAQVINILPPEWSTQERLIFFEELAEVYRKKSVKDITSEEAKFRANIGRKKIETYEPFLNK